jgi:tetratricopeptide (TPR) repeat protein
LEKRIKELEMEQGVPSAVESVENPDAELLDDQNPNGNSNGAHIMANGNSAPEPIVTTRSPESEQAAILLTKGQSLLDVEKVEEALECFEQALALEPKNPEALVKKGAALEKMRKLIEAIECYDLAIAADSTMTIAYLYKGGLCNRLERFNEALQCYEQALRTQEKRAA